MKSKFNVITGIIGFIALIIFLGLLILDFIDWAYEYKEKYWIYILILIGLLCLMIYLIQTRFWTVNTSRISKLNRENQIIKKQIEQEELKKKLKEVEKA